MAEDIKITLATKVEQLEKTKDSVISKNSKAFSATQIAEIESLFTRLKDSLKNFNPKSNRSLDSFNSSFNELVNIISKGARTLAKASPEFDKLTKEIEKIQEKIRATGSKYEAKSRGYDTKNNKFFDSAKKQEITEADIHYKVGHRQASNLSTLKTKVQEGAGVFASPEDYNKAKALVEKIQKEEQQTQETLAKINQDLVTLESQLQEKIKQRNIVSNQVAPELSASFNASNEVANVVNAQKTQNNEERQNEQRSKDAAAANAEMQALNGTINKQSSSLGKAFKQFTMYAIALRMAKKALREAIKTVKELDKALTEQAMVTGLSRKQTYGLLDTYQKMAARLGTTTKEVASTMTQFLRQGRSINESLKLSEAAISAAKVAGISAADSINYLTTAINGFRLSAEDAMKVSDKFAAVAATAATSYEEIAIALSKVAAQANLAGMSIDYTTALLTKGIETTREAPETIGTALKTVIARMRELSDYGETLGGDTDINNVESQLAYIGIALRDNNGELRSTEDVLNDLGGKWDELNANQQAAIAKALAGTRQQSRLIAMMSDYERVIELQQIAERSEGATVAQMSTYLEGMDAALNRVSNAWEQIVKNIINNESIIGFINYVSDFLNTIADFLSTDFGLVTTLTVIAGLTAAILGSKLQEVVAAKAQNTINNAILITKLKQRAAELKVLIAEKEQTIEEKKRAIHQKYALKREITLQKVKNKEISPMQAQLELNQQQVDEKREETELDLELAELHKEQLSVNQQLTDLGQTQAATWGTIGSTVSVVGGGLLSLITGSQTWLVIMTAIGIAFKAIPPIIKTIAALNKARLAQEKAGETQKSLIQMAGAATGLGVPGLIIAAALMALAGIAAVAGIIGAAMSSKEKEVDKINTISKDIYDLNKKATALDNVISKFDALDNKILKTNKDLEEMKSLLDSAADSLDEGEKAEYDSKGTIEGKAKVIRDAADRKKKQLAEKRSDLKKELNNWRANGGEEWQKFLTSSDEEYANARAAVYSLNNSALQGYIDNLKNSTTITDEAASATEHLVQALIEQYDIEEALELMNNPQKIQKYIDSIAKVQSLYTDAEGKKVLGNAAEILQSDDYTITERIQAYKKLESTLEGLADPELSKAFHEMNQEWETFSNMSSKTWEYIDKIGASIDGINDLAKAIQKLGYDADKSSEFVDTLFQRLQSGEDLQTAIIRLFGEKNLDTILNAYDKAFGTTILNMGQNVDKLKNTINSFYEKAADWSTMSDTEKTSFISENSDLFKGKDGADLLKAFESGNYQAIAEALGANIALTKQREQLLKDVNEQLAIELARSDKERNEAYIKELQDYKRQLEDVDKVYLASLKMRLDQQQSQLEMYKDMLQKETDALTEALNKRKEAYQKYFDTINQNEETEEYEEKVQTIMANISKLSSSSNADAQAKTYDLKKQFEELEKERLKELRQQAQEAVIQSIDDEVTKISDNLDKLLNNEQALLNAMLNDNQNSAELIASLMSAQFVNGNNTELGMQDYLQQMQATFASIMPNIDWSQVDVERQGDSLILNIMGQTVQLNDSEQQTIYDAIQSALKQLGYN